MSEPDPNAKIVSPTAAGGGTGSLANPWTLQEAGQQAVGVGRRRYLRGGAYPFAAEHTLDTDVVNVQSGSAGAGSIIYEAFPGELPIIRRGMKFKTGQSYLDFIGLRIETQDGKRCVTDLAASTAAHHLGFFACQANMIAIGDSSGFALQNGSDITFHDCRFEKFLHLTGEWIHITNCDRYLFEFGNMARSSSVHNPMNLTRMRNSRIRFSVFRNPYERGWGFTNDDPGDGAFNVVEFNLFFDCDWSQNFTHPDPGDAGNQSYRHSINRSIVRYNLFIRHNLGRTDGSENHSAIDMATQGTSRQYKENRFYHNVAHQSHKHDVTMASGQLGGEAINDVQFKNMVFSRAARENILINDVIGGADGQIPLATHRFIKCLFDSVLGADIMITKGGGTFRYTLAQAEAAFAATFPAGSNIAAQAIYVPSDAVLEAFLNNLDEDVVTPTKFNYQHHSAFFDNFRIRAGGPGAGAADPLATITATTTNGTLITVDDAYWFTAGAAGGGPVGTLGDRIIIKRAGGAMYSRTVVAVNSKTTMTVDSAVTVANGDKIWSEVVGVNGDVGIPLIVTPDMWLPDPPPVAPDEDEFPEENIIVSVGTGGTIPPIAGEVMARVITLNDRGEVRFKEARANGANRIAMKAPAALSADYDIILPTALPGSTTFLTIDATGQIAVSAGSSQSLDAAYHGGSTIAMDVAPITLNISSDIAGLDINKSSAGIGNLLDLDNQGTGKCFQVNNSATSGVLAQLIQQANAVMLDLDKIGSGAGNVLEIANDGTGIALSIQQDGLQTAAEIFQSSNAIGLFINKQGAAGGAGLKIQNEGTAPAILIDQDGGSEGLKINAIANFTVLRIGKTAVGGGNCIDIDNDGTGSSIFVKQDGVGFGLEIQQNGATDAIMVTQTGQGRALDLQGNYVGVAGSELMNLETINAGYVGRLMRLVKGGATLDNFIVTDAGGTVGTTGAKLTNGGTWTDGTCYRDTKEGHEPIDEEAMLEEISKTAIERWYQKSERGTPGRRKYLGCYQDDLVNRFGLGADGVVPREIACVALAGVKALYRRLARLEAQVANA